MLQNTKSLLSIKQFTEIKSVQNFFYLLFIQATNIITSLAAIPLIIKSIGIETFGLVNLSLSFVLALNLLVNFGFNISGPRLVAISNNNNTELSRIFSEITLSKLLLASVSFVSLLLSIFLFNAFNRYETILLFSTLILFSDALFPSWFAQGLEKLKIIAIGNFLSKLIYLVLLVPYISNEADGKYVNLFLGLSSLIVNISLVLIIIKSWNISLIFVNIKSIIDRLKLNFILFVSSAIGHISVSSGVIILSIFADNKTLGLFGLAERVILILRMTPVLIAQAIYPKASTLFIEDKNKFNSFIKKTLLLSTISLALISTATFILAPYIIYFFSESFNSEAITYIRMMSFIPLLATVNIYNLIYFLVANQKNALFLSSLLTCFYMLISSVVLSYNYGGYGMCLALLSTEVINFFACLIINVRNNRPDALSFYKSLILYFR